jgi:hypothetical protein
MRKMILAVAATTMAVPATMALPTDSAQAQSRYYRNGTYVGPTWRGEDGRIYCRRSNGTTGLIVGGAAGALLGREVERSGSRNRYYGGRSGGTTGAILGGAIGALVGRQVARSC